jgi:hypothetical protein
LDDLDQARGQFVVRLESVGEADHTVCVADDDAGALSAATMQDWLVNHERQVADDKERLALWAQRMEQAEPGSAERDRAREGLEDTVRLLKTHSGQLADGRVSIAAALRRATLATQRRRPALVLTIVQAVLVVALAVAGLVVSMPGWGWGIAALGAALCVAQTLIAFADDRSGWPPPVAGCTCALLVLAGLAPVGVLPGWVAVVAVAATVLIAAPVVAGLSLDPSVPAEGGQA